MVGISSGMTQTTPPWVAIDPELTAQRLDSISALIVRARTERLKHRHRWDTAWNLGCDAYAWCMSAISEAAAGVYSDWLKVISAQNALDFQFTVGRIPMKFYRPASAGQPARTLRQQFEELRAFQLLLGLTQPVRSESVYRLAVEVAEDGEAESVALVKLSASGDVEYHYVCWERDQAVLSLRDSALPEPVVLDEPIVMARVDLSKESARISTRRAGEQR